jgi:hypothetical protein
LVRFGRAEESRVVDQFSKGPGQRGHELLFWAPKVLRAKLHDFGNAVERALQLELSIKLDRSRSKTHFHPEYFVGREESFAAPG